MRLVDLNADMGEGFGPWTMGSDRELAALVTSASLACGFHAGDPSVMAHTVDLCLGRGVSVGAHPGYPDLQGFGRRDLEPGPNDVYGWTLYQVGALEAFLRARGGRLAHVKPHGALYNRAASDASVAREVARAVADFDPGLVVVCPAGSALAAAAADRSLPVAREAFVDRAYRRDGSLAPRTRPGAVLSDPEAVARRAVELCAAGVVPAIDGGEVRVEADTLCLHGDTPGAPAMARAVRAALEGTGISVAPLPRVLAAQRN